MTLEDRVQDHERRLTILEAELAIYRKGVEKEFLRLERDYLQKYLRDKTARLHAWRNVHGAWNRWARVCSSAENLEIVNEAIGIAVALDRER